MSGRLSQWAEINPKEPSDRLRLLNHLPVNRPPFGLNRVVISGVILIKSLHDGLNGKERGEESRFDHKHHLANHVHA